MNLTPGLAALFVLLGVSAYAAEPSFVSVAPQVSAGGSWTATSTSGAPQGRYEHSAVWTGSKMIVWGGSAGDISNSYVPLSSGGIFDPASNTWSATSKSGSPSARQAHTAVWTGSKMLVWGGFFWDGHGFDFVSYNDGAAYDPVANSWAPITQSGAPSARSYQTAVWTGSKMIVWGGQALPVSASPLNFQPLNTGGIFDPETNGWVPTSTVNAPSARTLHTAVWTGSKMIVWGGNDGISDDLSLNSGGVYDPATDTWTTITSAHAPSVREAHTAVWTGSRMIVWGGFDTRGSSATNSGGIYDPESDTWMPTSTAGAPTPRDVHVSVWTGSQMIVWAGFDGASDLKTGALYNPGTDSWTAMTTTGAPPGREESRAIWTGSQMIAWGGYNGSVDDNAGGLFTPPSLPCPADGGRECVTPIVAGTDAHATGRISFR